MSKKPLLKQQKAYKQNAQNRANFKRLLDAETKEAEERIRQRFPEFKELGAVTNSRVFNRTPKGKGKTKAILKIIELLLNDRLASKKQAEVLKEVQDKFSEIQLLPNIWNKELHPTVLRKIKAKIDGDMTEPISIRGLKKLSEIRKAIYSTRKIKGAKKVFKKTIALSKQEVVIGKTIYRVELRNKGKPSQKKAVRVTVRGKREWVNFAPLCAILLEAE